MGYITIDATDVKELKNHGFITRDEYLTKEGACVLGRLEADKLYEEFDVSYIEGTEVLCRIGERLLKEENFKALLSVISEAFQIAGVDEPIYMDFLLDNSELEMLYIKEFIILWRECLKQCYE